MLRFLRNKKTAKKIWIGLAFIIIPAFAFWGFGGAGRDKNEASIAGKIFGRTITNIEFRDAIGAVRTMAIMQFGDRLPEIEKYLNLEARAKERLILLHEAKARHIRVKDSEIINEIQNSPYFQDKKGFNNKLYQEILRYGLRLQPRAFEEQTRENLMLAKLYQQVTQNINFNDEQIRQEYLKINQELSIHYIRSLNADYAAKIKPTDREINDFYEKNKPLFKEPPTADKPTRIPELAEIKEKVKAVLIMQAAQRMAESKIKECAQALKTYDFKQAAKTCGLKTNQSPFFKSSGEVENLGAAEMFWNAAKKLKINETSDILSNEKGFYIIRLGEIKPIDEAAFAKEKPEFSKSLINAKKSEAFANFTEESIKKSQ